MEEVKRKVLTSIFHDKRIDDQSRIILKMFDFVFHKDVNFSE